MPSTALLILTLLAATTPEPPAPPPPVILEFPLEGFRIDALNPATEKHGVFTMSLPGSSNSHSLALVTVDNQPTTKGRPSLQNIKDAKTLRALNGDTILMERTASPAEWLMEYTSNLTTMGTKSATKTHTYQRVVSANGTTYNISATAPDTQWSEVGPRLKTSVDSFELSSAPAPGKFAFPQQGFRISKLDGTVPADAQQTLLLMRGLGDVYVEIEPYTKTLKDYQAEYKSRVTIPNGKFKILAENAPTENTLVTEYAEEAPPDKINPQGSQLLVYEKVVLAHGQLYSATGLHWDWDKAVSAAQIKALVDSLEIMPLPAPAPAPAK